jgi:hypothetical protein
MAESCIKESLQKFGFCGGGSVPLASCGLHSEGCIRVSLQRYHFDFRELPLEGQATLVQ